MSRLEFRQFICRACGLIYDEAQGDEDSGLAPGTRFEDIPEDWACPLCGVTKADFEPHDPLPSPTLLGARSARPLGRGAQAASQSPGAGRPLSPRLKRPAGVVVVGGGTAAWSLVEKLRALDPHRPMTLVTACSGDRYDKPRLSVACKQGVQAAQLVKERGIHAAQRLQVRLMAHTHAFSADAHSRMLRTTRGTFQYEELVLAHGSAPRSCPGLPDELAWRINDLRAYSGLRTVLAVDSAARRTVLIVGAGLVGCELANDLALAGHPVTVLDVADRPLAMAQPEQSQALLSAWAGLPIAFVGHAQVQQARRLGNGRTALELRDGRTLEGDVLVSAVGLSTPSQLACSLGLDWADGIAVDPQTLLTGVAHVHALGDCISLNGRAQRFIEPIHRQARLLAARLCGEAVETYESAPPVVRVKTSSMPLTLA